MDLQLFMEVTIINYPKKITNVAIYLRKSRQDKSEVDALEKHRIQLVNFVENNNWSYQVIEEIGTSQDISFRKKFSYLLEQVESNIFDAVVCMDFDRITRAGMDEYSVIQKAFATNQTLIITPHEFYDLSDSENIMNPIKAVMGNYEFLQIRKRLKEGKVRSARMGKWVNGKPPYGYWYDRNTKQLEIMKDEAKVVQMIFNRYLEKTAMYKIAHELNLLGYRTSNGSFFQDATISRILNNRVYIGDNVFGKSKGSGHLNKKTTTLEYKDEDDWIIVPNSHPPIIDKETFDKVKIDIKKRTRMPTKARSGRYALSGLLFCGKCGRSMRFNRKDLVKRKNVSYVVKCQSSDPFGNRCDNKGIELKTLITEIERQVNTKILSIKDSFVDDTKDTLSNLNQESKLKNSEINKHNLSLERIKELYIEGEIDKEERKSRSNTILSKIDKLNKELINIENSIAETSNQTKKERILRFEEFKSTFSMENDDESINHALRELIKSIHYTRVDNTITLELTYM